jgi:hypothetical protein
MLWSVLGSAMPGDANLLPSAGALASYAPDYPNWEAVGGKVSQALVSVNPVFLGSWLDALRPVGSKLTAQLATIFQEKSRPEAEHALATNILADYAADEPDRLAELLMVSDPRAFQSLFSVALKRAERILPVFQAELARKATHSWNDPPLDRSWTKPDADLVGRIESAQGMVAERFVFCQTMALDEFLTTAFALRKSGYRPTRFRPFSNGGTVRVAAVWTRDGRDWRSASGLSSEQIRREDEKNRNDKFLPVDVAGYIATESDGKPVDRYAALWVERSSDDNARMYVGTTRNEQDEVQNELSAAKLIPRTLDAMVGSEGYTRYSGVWGRPPKIRRCGADLSRPVRGKLRTNASGQERPVALGRSR